MKNTFTLVTLLIVLISVPNLTMAQGAEGRLSLVTNPRVMVYIDGSRVGMTPLINRSVTAGEHQMALLLILPNGNRLRADYRLIIASGQETTASLDLVRNAPSEGEVPVVQPAQTIASVNPPANPPADPPADPPTNPPADPSTNPPADPSTNPPANQSGSGWATNPGQPSPAPVSMAPQPRNTQPTSPPQPSQNYSLSREMVREGLEALRPVIQRCMAGRNGVIQVRLVIQPDGGVTDVEAQGVYRGTNAGDCIERQVPEEAAFPIYDGDPIPVVYPYRFAPQ